MPLDLVNHGAGQGVRDGCASTATLQPFPGSYFCADPKQLAAVRGVGPRRVSSWRRRHRRDPRGLAPPWGTGMRRGSRQTQRPASEPPGPTVAADDAPTSCLGDNGTASLPWALSTATCSAQVRRPASRPSCPSFPTPSQPQRPTPRCRQICAGTTSSCSNFPGGSVHFRPFPREKISPAPGNRIRLYFNEVGRAIHQSHVPKTRRETFRRAIVVRLQGDQLRHLCVRSSARRGQSSHCPSL